MSKSKLQALRNESVSNIIAILKKHRYSASDFRLSSTPIISADPFDDNNTYTLDCVELSEDNRSFTVDASNCSDIIIVMSDNLSLDNLIEIEDFLQDNEDVIWDDDLQQQVLNFLLEEYHNQNDCLADFLDSFPISEIQRNVSGELTIDTVKTVFMILMNMVEGDKFYRINEKENWKENLLDFSEKGKLVEDEPETDDSKLLVCKECGSKNVQVLAWNDANTNEFISDGPNDRDSFWCSDCSEHHRLCFKEDFIEKMNSWFSNADFKTMEKNFGLNHEDFDEEDGYQAFVDECETRWKSLSYEEKRNIYNENK